MGANENSNKNNVSTSDGLVLGATNSDQQILFHVERQTEVQDVEMGVLDSGIPYLTGRGLERLCGVGHGPFGRLTTNWQEEKFKPRGRAITELLQQSGYFEDELYLKAEFNGRIIHAFTEPVCLALLEYYAFVSDEPREQAIRAFRNLAKLKFRDFVYDALGYRPENKILDSWRHFHDRIDMTFEAVPSGHFSVFKEIASMIVPMIRSGLIISDKVIPDISVGRAWSDYWKNSSLEAEYGQRIRYEHNYPPYYPQAKSNPQPAYAYPDSCLGIFRAWLRENYIITKFPKYLLGQTKQGKLAANVANQVIETFVPKTIDKK